MTPQQPEKRVEQEEARQEARRGARPRARQSLQWTGRWLGQPVLEGDQARRFDRWAIDDLGMPGAVMMESAAAAVVTELMRRWPAVRRVLVVCGPGNNGADGLAVSRLLVVRGVGAEAALLARSKLEDEPESDAALQLRTVRRLGVPLHDELPDPASFDLVVDALFGTGLSRPLSGRAADWVGALNGSGMPIVAVDTPSGLAAPGEGEGDPGPLVRADLTVSFVAAKGEQLIGKRARACGELVVAPLAVHLGAWPALDVGLELLGGSTVVQWLGGPRDPDSHKGGFGHLLVVAGSLGMSGACRLAAAAAPRSGVGLLTAAPPRAVRAEVASALPEAMTLDLPGDGDGDGARLDESAAGDLLADGERYSALALGPGLGRGDAVRAAVLRLVRSCPRPLVVDADGLNAFASLEEIADVRSEQAGEAGGLVLTPHPGELGRLLGLPAAAVQADRLAAVREAARLAGAVVLLKGRHSLIAGPAGRVWINPTGGPALATAGSGDVLTGVVAALLAQGLEPLLAAATGAFAHGLAGELAGAEQGERSAVAGDLVEALPIVFRQLDDVAAGRLEGPARPAWP